MRALPKSIDETQEILGRTGYLCGRALATVVFLSLKLGKPLFLEASGRLRSGTGSRKLATG